MGEISTNNWIFSNLFEKKSRGGSFFQKLTLAPRLNKEKVDLFYIYGTI